MKDVLVVLGIVVAWFALQKFILPAFGVST